MQKANEALSAIYGINDYTPQGHFKYTKEPGMKAIGSTIPSYTEVEGWTNPRPFMGGQR